MLTLLGIILTGIEMASNGGVQNKIAILGSYGGSNRPIIGMSYVLINYASLRPKVKKTSTSLHAE